MIQLQPMETCPRVEGVPRVLCVDGIPVVASWTETGFSRPGWSLWFDRDDYCASPRDFEPEGWWDVQVPERSQGCSGSR